MKGRISATESATHSSSTITCGVIEAPTAASRIFRAVTEI